MRFRSVLSITVAAHAVAAARQCVPHPLSGSVSSSVTTSGEAGTTSASAVTSDTTTTTTAFANPSVGSVTSTFESGTAATESTKPNTPSPQTDATSSELPASATTTVATSTRDGVSPPIATFELRARNGGEVDGQYLQGPRARDGLMGWSFRDAPPRLSFSIDPATKYVRESSGYYLCVRYGDIDNPHLLQLCDIANINLHEPTTGFPTCEQTRSGTLNCSVPAATCSWQDAEIKLCTDLPGTFTQFYTTYTRRTAAIFLAIAPPGDPFPESRAQAVELEVTAIEA